ncbi:hypothetical protein F5148DRAFT_1279163 [Russula earlei]|uniref:Uncharacterized protein n=1 Tax=Russula earlei TaxID=71964 RepID=A0ACC0UN33_9AGAM|nr:hypothetical protein F5148DRAFT_1279163 [Russula earlei]
MFRASPWITYDPPSDSQPSQPMVDNDTEMDAPQISTLHDDGESPPTHASPARTGKFRVKLLVNEAKVGTKFITFNGETGEEAGVAGEAEDEDGPDEDEEDELIDDEEDASTPAPSSSGAGAAGAGASSATKSGTKRPLTKTKSSQARRKARLGGASAAPPASLPAAASLEAQGNLANDGPDAKASAESQVTLPQATTLAPSPGAKNKAVPKGTTAAQRAPRKSASKPKTTTAVVPPTSDAAADVSEGDDFLLLIQVRELSLNAQCPFPCIMTGHAGTVPSSPAHVDARTPEPEPEQEAEQEAMPAGDTAMAVFAVPALEPTTLEDIEGVPHPRYPLPTKPFQVQPAPKISTGYAPIVPLDRTKSKPRHWRMAHREIRGISGGRWFARAWVGDKDSELAVATEAALSLPKLPALSISTPPSVTRTPGKRKPKADAISTAASSRSASAAPEGVAPPAPLQRSATKKSALSTAVVASDVDMDIDLVS